MNTDQEPVQSTRTQRKQNTTCSMFNLEYWNLEGLHSQSSPSLTEQSKAWDRLRSLISQTLSGIYPTSQEASRKDRPPPGLTCTRSVRVHVDIDLHAPKSKQTGTPNSPLRISFLPPISSPNTQLSCRLTLLKLTLRAYSEMMCFQTRSCRFTITLVFRLHTGFAKPMGRTANKKKSHKRFCRQLKDQDKSQAKIKSAERVSSSARSCLGPGRGALCIFNGAARSPKLN